MIDPSDRGHRRLPHTADVIVEAWGPTRVACLEEAARGVVGTFAESAAAPVERSVPVTLDATDDEDLLVLLLEEVVYLLEVLGVVPVDLDLEEAEDGTVAGFFETVPVDRVEPAGAPPKGVSRSGLAFEQRDDGRWHCRVTVDV